MTKRLPAAGAALVVSYLATLFAPRWNLPREGSLALIALTVACFGWFIFEEIRCLRALDEMHQRIQLEALAIAFPLSILLIVSLGLLQRVITLPAGDLSYRHVWPFLLAFYFVGLTIARRRYR